MDLATREREYSPSSVIGGDYRPFLQRYAVESEAARRRLPVRADLRYGEARRATLDLFPHPAARGLLVYVHGGYWQELSKETSAFLSPAWHEQGFAHAVVGYTLAPEATVPEIVAECVSAVDWLVEHAPALGYPADRVVVAGSSAGAHLAAAVAAVRPVSGMVLLSGVYDLAPLMGTSIDHALGLDPATCAALDLLRRPAAFAPAVVAWGEIETAEFVRQSREFAAHLAERGTPCTTFAVPGRNHFDVVHELGDPGSPVCRAARALFPA